MTTPVHTFAADPENEFDAPQDLTAPTDIDAIVTAHANPGVAVLSNESGDHFEYAGDTPVTVRYTGWMWVVEDNDDEEPADAVPASKRFGKAMRELRSNGLHARTAVPGCCRGCIGETELGYTDEMADKDVPLVWTYGGQGRKTKDIDSGETLMLNHANITGDVERVVRAVFDSNGLAVDWDGSTSQCIGVYDSNAVSATERAATRRDATNSVRAMQRRADDSRWRREDAARKEATAKYLQDVEAWAAVNLVDPSKWTFEQKEAMCQTALEGGTK